MTTPRHPEDLLQAVRTAGVDLQLDRTRGRLRLRPPFVIDDHLRAELRGAKAGLQALLEAHDPPADACARCGLIRTRLVRGYWWPPIPGGYCPDCASGLAIELDKTNS